MPGEDSPDEVVDGRFHVEVAAHVAAIHAAFKECGRRGPAWFGDTLAEAGEQFGVAFAFCEDRSQQRDAGIAAAARSALSR
ncbi:hypothetical protein SAZ11_45570 [Streptomyces sp. FXJ1.4098]|nr:hypothetical protein [Streptomyces sp. FXJ1.4098]